jgi:hypothetical protein
MANDESRVLMPTGAYRSRRAGRFAMGIFPAIQV